MFRKMGPGVVVAAAFIGPGTVTVCTFAGVQFGYTLLWAMLLSIVATVVLQQMAARLGIVTQKGLAHVIKEEIGVEWIKILVLGLILSAIVIGNAAYEGGNIGGASLGLVAIFGQEYLSFYPFAIGLVAFLLLFFGNYKLLEKVFVTLVVIMSLSFILTAIITKPDILAILQGLFTPKVPEGSILTIIALVGTTVVPYNLFLHTSLVSEKWKSTANLKDAERDTVLSIVLGGMVSMAVMVTATAIPSKEINNIMDMAQGLEPLYGNSARYFMGIGLFAAGTTSAITAPLAAAYVANSCFGWNTTMKDIRFKLVWMVIILVGVLFMSIGIKPLEIIKFAQVTNGMLLPIIAVFLLWVVNRKTVMLQYRNTLIENILGIIIILLSVILGVKSILTVFELF
ncbi:Nramp family divalent metal transporter [Arenibacter sp. BSSL-BM3]|uniref:Nramp family divalent metal transporter n=1 Tax=Arenibacter arenosicollis TaxID=2762274 RepID=A0ABR7QLQ8_9FLAO|nr:Nramp family divalent metal transporter [Arenibacter arenosicollis]MBC8768127.1 Nramp family divalent metal transporter [Arenibacter arenosicollis]